MIRAAKGSKCFILLQRFKCAVRAGTWSFISGGATPRLASSLAGARDTRDARTGFDLEFG